jgi:hypothetical protein
MNKFYLYRVGAKYIKVNNGLKCSLTNNINNASFWSDKKQANTWGTWIGYKYPNHELVQAELTLTSEYK